MIWDAIVIGGSFAGLSAAMQLARGQRQVLLIDAGEPRNRFAAQSHGFFAADGAEPGELRGRAWQQLMAYPTVQFRQSRVNSAAKLAAAIAWLAKKASQRLSVICCWPSKYKLASSSVMACSVSQVFIISA